MSTQFTNHISLPEETKAKLIDTLNTVLATSGEHKDPATGDLYTEVLRATELDMWFLESHLSV